MQKQQAKLIKNTVIEPIIMESSASKSEIYSVPTEEQFEDSVTGFLDAEDLEAMGKMLIQRHGNGVFKNFDRLSIKYAWKKSGGKNYGVCERMSGKSAYLSGDSWHYFIWLGADNVRDNELTEYQVEALVFHELCHIRLIDGKWSIAPHDFEGFGAEIEQYGLWSQDAKAIAPAFEQLNLFTDEG